MWDSLAIAEYLAERHGDVWPRDTGARAWARSAAAEMHSGFVELRNRCSMSCGVRVRLKERPPALERDLERLEALFGDGLSRFGGPFLAGDRSPPSTPSSRRWHSEFKPMDCSSAPPRRPTWSACSASLHEAWYAAGIQERFRDVPHEEEIAQMATVTRICAHDNYPNASIKARPGRPSAHPRRIPDSQCGA